ncbi:unnamed protein product [Symbiodinium sp. CCMP2592]|nr:unnamed protein product [Symbiodinium sp. CCMP2592]
MAGREGSPGPLRYRLWCGGLYKDITEDEIRQRVEPFADVIKVMLRSSVKDTFCFIQFRSQKDMDIAREKLDQSNLLGDRVCAQPATADKKKDGGPPVYESRRPPKAEGMGKGGGKDKGSDYGRRPRSRTPAGHDDRHGGKGNQKPRYQDGPRGPHAGEGRSDRRRDDGPGMPRPDSREARRPDPQWELRDAGGRGPRGDRREDRGREDYRVEDFRKESFRREDFRRDDFRRDDFRREDFPRDDRRDDPRRDEPRRRDDYRRDDFRQEDFRRPPPGREEPPREPRRDDRRDDFRREDLKDHRRGAAAPRREEIRAPDPRGPDPRREDYRRDGPRREERPERERERSHRDLREPRADLPAPRGPGPLNKNNSDTTNIDVSSKNTNANGSRVSGCYIKTQDFCLGSRRVAGFGLEQPLAVRFRLTSGSEDFFGFAGFRSYGLSDLSTCCGSL